MTTQVPRTENERTDTGTSFVILHDFPCPEVERVWHDFLRRVEYPAHYDSPEFFREPYLPGGKNRFAILALNQGLMTGVLTGVHKGDRVESGLESRPQICVDTTVDSSLAADTLARGLLAEAGSASLITVYTWSSLQLPGFESYRFRHRELEGDVVLDLTQGPEALFKQLHASRRKNIRRGIRGGVEVFQAKTLEDAEAFCEPLVRGYHTLARGHGYCDFNRADCYSETGESAE